MAAPIMRRLRRLCRKQSSIPNVSSLPGHVRKPTYRYDLLRNQSSDVRLLTLHPGSATDTLHLELFAHPIPVDDLPAATYEAISYVWGSEKAMVVVDFGAGAHWSMEITPNLAEVLTQLRHRDKQRTIWVDALCIDQGNVEERSAQVANMGSIFHHADRVVSWLGPEADNSNRALQVLEEIGSQVDIHWETQSVFPSADARDTSIADTQIPLPYSMEDGDGVYALLHRPWFERLWIRQEVAMARTAIIQAGTHAAPWELFRKGIACIRAKPRNADSFLAIERARLRLVYNVCLPASSYNVAELHRRIQGAKCKNPRDKIYSMLSILHESNPHLDIKPDYTASLAEVYQDVVLQDIRGTQSLSILAPCRYDEGQSHALPSWVPNWADDRSPGLGSPSLAGEHIRPIYEYKGRGVLSVAGLACATVVTSRHVHDVPEWKLLAELQSTFEELEEVGASSVTGSRSQYVAGGSVMEALCRTLFVNRFRETLLGSRPDMPEFSDVRPSFVEFLEASVASVRSGLEVDFLRCHGKILRRGTLFVTEEGYVGCGPKGAQPGDVVVMVLGCRKPMMLRPVMRSGGRDQYRVVGECYVQGIMAAEPLLGPLPIGTRLVLFDDGESGIVPGFRDDWTGRVALEDPRIGTLFAGLGEDVGGGGKVEVGLDMWKRAGKAVGMFDLI